MQTVVIENINPAEKLVDCKMQLKIINETKTTMINVAQY